MKKAFTIFELLVAMALIVVLLAGSGLVFHTSVQAHRKASSTAEISRKLLAIIQQLNDDFKNIRPEGELLMAWVPSEIKDDDGEVVGYERFDRVMFFASGDFHSYQITNPIDDTPMDIQGDIARISYMIAKDNTGFIPGEPSDRILARVQHIYSADASLGVFPDLDPTSFDVDDFLKGEKKLEYDTTTMKQWKEADINVKEEMLTVISNLRVDLDGADGVGGDDDDGVPTGAEVDTSDPESVHKLFCEGVGQFIVQHWYVDPADPTAPRWWPEIDIDGVPLDLSTIPGWLYPGDGTLFDECGKALKFTFTLYDSRGVFPEGKTFTHIVYLD